MDYQLVRKALEICDNAYMNAAYCRKVNCPYAALNISGECIGALHKDIRHIFTDIKEEKGRKYKRASIQ